MVNLGFNITTLLGILDIFGAVGYFILSIVLISRGVISYTSGVNTILQVWELLLCPIALLISGIILFFNGWRLDPFLQYQQLLVHSVLMVAVIKHVRQLVGWRR